MMRSFLALTVCTLVLGSCSNEVPPDAATTQVFLTPTYELLLPSDPKALLVLFPGFGGDTTDTRTESKITSEANAQGVAVMLMAFNRQLFMSQAEMDEVTEIIADGITSRGLNVDRVVLGGYSSGGNVSVLLAKHLVEQPDKGIPLKGVFVVDSPLDLTRIYTIWKKHEHSPYAPAREESTMVIALLDSALGSPVDSAANYERFSPVTTSAASVAPLKDLAVRLYTEPDTAWWRINRGDSYTDMNACYLEKLGQQLKAAGNTRAEFIATQGRGIQHGHRHAWSIVEEKDLVRWVLTL